jgi:RHS repeat-associated protein
VFYVHTDHLNSPRKVAQPSSGTLAWRWDTDPFGTAAPNQNPAGLGTFVYNLRAPGQYYQAETGLNQNVNRDYDPLTAKYIESDPIGLRGGVNTYAYTLANPLWYLDADGREITCGGYFCGTNTPAYVPPSIREPPNPYYGGEGHFFLGGGLTSITCTTECGKKQTFRYWKVCLGAAVGASASGGVTGGLEGKSCRQENYAGYFYEAGVATGYAGTSLDIGYTGQFGHIPDGLSGVKETGAGLGLGVLFKSTWCYYFPLQ